MTAPTVPAASAAAIPSGDPNRRLVAQASWALYDFANTIFSFAVVSGAIGLYLVNDRQFGERDGNLVLSLAVVISVGINALVSPILGAFSDRGGRRMPFLLVFTALCIAATFFIADVPPVVGVALFIVANFAYQAALIYYDATLKTVSTPETRGRLSGIGTGIGYCGTVFIGLLIFLLDAPSSTASGSRRSCSSSSRSRSSGSSASRGARTRRRSRAADVADSFGQLKRSIAHAREVPGPVAVPDRPLLLLRRRQHRDRRHERRGRRRPWACPTRPRT